MNGVFMNTISMLKRVSVTVCAVCAGLASAQATAENPGGWEYSIAPLYIWAKSIDGTSGLGPTESELDLDFKDDILENLDTAYTVHFEATQGDLSLFAQYNYSKLDPSVNAHVGPVPVKVSVDFEETIWEAGVRYVVANTGPTQWQVFGGVRGIDQDIDIKIKGEGPGQRERMVTGGDDWWHGFGGVGVTTKVSENWKFVAKADMGYKNSDNKSVNVLALFDYRFRDWGSFFAGYRFLQIDYHNNESGADTYFFDGDQRGPAVGVKFYF